jgi:GDP-4-dehydro-6-deoxy-D-mannose reductase
MKTVLVTGANGFIGKHLIRKLANSTFSVQGIGSDFGDLSDGKTWERLPSFDVVIHLAAKSSVPTSWNFFPDFLQSNCMGMSHALDFCRQRHAKIIFLSSYMYGDAGDQPIPETAPVFAKNPYALTKQFSEKLCEFYKNNFSVESQILRPFNVYGPEQSEEFLISKIVREAQTLGRVHVKDIEPRRDFIYIDDLISAIVKLISYSGPHHIFNIGSGKSHSVLEVINLVQKLLQRTIDITNDEVRRPGEIMDSVANIELAQAELGWSPNYSLCKGLSRMIVPE